MDKVENIVIVGGGTAGWLTAGVIASRHQGRRPHGFSVTLVESPNVPTIGVGEGTWPTLRTTLRKMGVSETEFFRECDAAFKQGARFNRWTTGEADEGYYHPLMLPQGFARLNLVPHWLEDGEDSFCDAVTPQGRLCDRGLAPKTIATPEFESVANYAYHLDAGKFSDFLRRHCCEKLGVRHVLADVTEIETGPNGDVTRLKTEQGPSISGDLFVDCTGFRALLIGGAMQVPFRECSDVLFCDTALAVQVPYQDPADPVASHTISTAQSAGWIWDIGLPTRRGVGHVFSSAHIDADEAERELRAYIGPAADDLTVRRIPIRSGHRETFWKGNVVAVGLSAGFLEPLEASAIVLIELSAKMIAEQLPPNRAVMDVIARRYNDTTAYRWGRIIDFLKLHYSLTKRTDTDFWRDNTRPETIPDRLRGLMELWKYQAPWLHDEFDRAEEVFPAASYQYVLYGMGYRTALPRGAHDAERELAQRALRENRAHTARLMDGLPPHRDLLDKITEHAMMPV
ncbi:tryptophan halogenase [Altererythrobacter atlanticus]|uniref:Flavin-dependent tryptophan halogenase RebH n=1 Tax=Croceibacterium atlanticum TaxID=1267766 RepID=A0A0F7KRZ8_9SPHN|nr:tryptophan halogenase family protein [Croceibacterium atlanticum]AKH43233.1 Flavin-dependent tryptophan halogenase RebH [Croceibacterium atlanticum]MBB5732061.1 tryptophan halogenase [Croceibacterium atlanticum]